MLFIAALTFLTSCQESTLGTDPVETSTSQAPTNPFTRYFHDGIPVPATEIIVDSEFGPTLKSRENDGGLLDAATIGIVLHPKVNSPGDTTWEQEIHLFSTWEIANASDFVNTYGFQKGIDAEIHHNDLVGATPDDQISDAIKQQIQQYNEVNGFMLLTGIAWDLPGGFGDQRPLATTPTMGGFNNRTSSWSSFGRFGRVQFYRNTWWRGRRQCRYLVVLDGFPDETIWELQNLCMDNNMESVIAFTTSPL